MAGPVGSNDFFLDAADGKDCAAQGNFTGHGDVVADRFTGQGRRNGRGHGNPG